MRIKKICPYIIYEMVVFAYNTCPSSKLKVSPFYLLHGIVANQSLDNKLMSGENEVFNGTKSLKQLQTIRETIPEIIKKRIINKKNYTIKNTKTLICNQDRRF
jgi:hypothetical protein